MPLNHNEGKFGQNLFKHRCTCICMSWLLGSGLSLSLSPFSLSLPLTLPSLSLPLPLPSLPLSLPPLSLTQKVTDLQYMLIVVVDIMPSNWNNFTSTMFGSCINCTESHTHSTPTQAHSHTHVHVHVCNYFLHPSHFKFHISKCTLNQRQLL